MTQAFRVLETGSGCVLAGEPSEMLVYACAHCIDSGRGDSWAFLDGSIWQWVPAADHSDRAVAGHRVRLVYVEALR